MPLNLLTDAQIRRAKPSDKPQRLSDGGSLYLLVQPTGGRWWRLDYSVGGKRKTLSLGTYPEITLAQARQKAQEARNLVRNGVDPSAERKASRTHAARHGDLSKDAFRVVAETWYESKHVREVSPAHAERNKRRLEIYIYPALGARPIGQIEPPDILACLQPLVRAEKLETADRVKNIVGQVMRYGIAHGYCRRDVTADLRDALPKAVTRHYSAATDPDDLAALLRAINHYKGNAVVVAALKLAALTFLRSTPLRLGRWEEIDWDAKQWLVPAARMKGTKQQKLDRPPFVVPLSRQALAILRELQPLTGDSGLIFHSLHRRGRPISDATLSAAIHAMGFEHVPHGFRASAKTLLVERKGIAEAVVEAQLAHAPKAAHGRAYTRAEFLEQRREMMQVWADYLDSLTSSPKL